MRTHSLRTYTIGAILAIALSACDASEPPDYSEDYFVGNFELESVSPKWYPYFRIPDDWPPIDSLLIDKLPTIISYSHFSATPYAVIVLESGKINIKSDGTFEANFEVDWFRGDIQGVSSTTGGWTMERDTLFLTLSNPAATVWAVPSANALHVNTWLIPVSVMGLDDTVYGPYQLDSLVFKQQE